MARNVKKMKPYIGKSGNTSFKAAGRKAFVGFGAGFGAALCASPVPRRRSGVRSSSAGALGDAVEAEECILCVDAPLIDTLTCLGCPSLSRYAEMDVQGKWL